MRLTLDDETVQIDLSKLDASVQEIVFVVTIHEADTRKQNFGQVRNSFIRIYYNAQEHKLLSMS
jgi:tellurium resistance protein TerD